MNIRLLEKNDLNKGFLELLQEAWDVSKITDETFEEFVNQNCFTYVAEEDDTVIGSATLHIQKKLIRNGGKCGLIEEVVVSQQHRNKRIGSKLIDCLIEKSKEEGCYKVILSCSPDKVFFYKNNGFYEDAITMRINLK
jgi:glucosamine-phosphate N-acetyltransferase